MATYVVGDVQGCFTTLERLLVRMQYDGKNDRIWLAGDLVNRGPRSLDVLRWAVGQGDRVHAVLGNHDLHLLMRAAGLRDAKGRDTLDDLLAARDRDDLLAWLRTRPFVIHQAPYLVVHAGLLPAWTLAETLALADAASVTLATSDDLLAALAGGSPPPFERAQTGLPQLTTAVSAFISLRMLDKKGQPIKFSGPPDEGPKGALPWYDFPGRKSKGQATILFGHWAAHDFVDARPSHVALDSGCVWGRALTAVRLDDFKVFQEPAADGTHED